jgi:hypothetical protein
MKRRRRLTAAAPIAAQPAAEQCGDEELPGCGRAGPAEDAYSQEDCASLRGHRNAGTRLECRQIGQHDRTNDKMRGHRGRDQRHRPAPILLNRLQVDRRAVKADLPTQDRQDESSANDTPAKEDAGAPRHARRNPVPHPSHSKSLHGGGGKCCGNARSIGTPKRVDWGRLNKEETMNSQSAFAEVAALAGDPARAGMLHALMDGRALTASELARVAGITPQTASGHLARLAVAGLSLSRSKAGIATTGSHHRRWPR